MTDILQYVIILFQATDLLLTSILAVHIFLPLPCSLVSVFSGSWQFCLLWLIGYLNCISIIQLCIIFQWTWVLDWGSSRVLAMCTVFAVLFAALGLTCDIIFVRKDNSLKVTIKLTLIIFSSMVVTMTKKQY